MKHLFAIFTFFFSFQIFGKGTAYYKTTDRRNLHYLIVYDTQITVYKIGKYLDKAGSGPAVLSTDTLYLKNQNEFAGKNYSVVKKDEVYDIISDKGKKYKTEVVNEIKVHTDLNNAYCLKSYFDLSERLNREFPLYHYSFRTGYYAWDSEVNKSATHHQYMEKTDREMVSIYDSISKLQNAYTLTTNFIVENADKVDYSILRDSISALPIDFSPNIGYFDQSVYRLVKANAEYFYKLLQDFPSRKQFIYHAVEQDKNLIRQLRQVEGYDDLKKEFVKENKSGKLLVYKSIGTYAAFAGLIAWLIIAQP